MTYSSTVTSKGTITLPAEFRAQLKINPGQRLSISLNAQKQMVIDAPIDIATLRKQISEQLETNGFTDEKLQDMANSYTNGDGMAAYVKEKYGPNS